MKTFLLIRPRFRHLPVRPLIERPLTERMIRAWASWQGMRDCEQRAWLAQRGLFPISGGGEVALRKIQAGLETTRGTSVAATRIVYAKGSMVKDVPPMLPGDEDRGKFISRFRSKPGLISASFPLTASLTYEDLPWLGQLAWKGGVTGVLSATSVYTYTFVPTAGSDDLKTATFESGDDTQAFEMAYCMLDSFDISGAIDGYWMGDLGLIGDDMAPATFTGSLSDRTVEDISMYLTKLAIGAAAAVPSSYMTGRFIAFKLSTNNHLARKYFADGAATSQKIGGMGRGKREFSLEVTMEGNAATVTERGVWETGTAKVARLTATGTTIASSSPSTPRSADIILPGKWDAFPIGERDTNTVFTGTLASEYDATLGYDLSVAVANALATLP